MSKSFVQLAAVAASVVIGGSALAAQPDLNGIWGGNLVSGGTCAVDKPIVDTRNRQAEQAGTRQTYQGRTGTQQWVTAEQDCGVGHRGKLDRPAARQPAAARNSWRTVSLPSLIRSWVCSFWVSGFVSTHFRA